MLKVAFGMIVFEGDYVLKESLESVYPYAKQILIAEGPVKYWQERGRRTSTDKTNEILANFPDPENKIKIVHGQFQEKDDQCKAYLQHIDNDIDYIWNLDSDEVFKGEDILKLYDILEKEKYTSVGVKSCSFYGGFNRVIGGFEEKTDNFLRVFKFYKGATWKTHRPPTIVAPPCMETLPTKHLDSDTLFDKYGIQMYHYSYVFPKQVANKIEYYKAKVSKSNCIDGYFEQVYMPWICVKNDKERFDIESKYQGVHEFKPEVRGPSFTKSFTSTHPASIQNNMKELAARFEKESQEYRDNLNLDQLCWNRDKSYEKILDGAKGILFPTLLNSDHVHVLSGLIELAQPDSIIDLGCASAEASLLVKGKTKYIGADLPQMIENVAKVMHPELEYVTFNANDLDFDFIKDYDTVLANAFIDVLPNGYEVLEAILQKAKKNVILHRQGIEENSQAVLIDSPYGGKTYRYRLGFKQFKKLLAQTGFYVKQMYEWKGNDKSFLLCRK